MTVHLQRLGLLTIAALATVNLWTGGPLFAVWFGSRVIQGDSSQLKMESVFGIIAILGLVSFGLLRLLTWARAKYDDVTGVEASVRRAPWMRSMRGEREEDIHASAPMNAIDKIVMLGVILAVIAFEVWFFFFSGSSLPNQ
jgi:hypothetical protein